MPERVDDRDRLRPGAVSVSRSPSAGDERGPRRRDALAFVADLARAFAPRRAGAARAPPRGAGAARRRRAPRLPRRDRGRPRAATGRWRRCPPDLLDRRVEITGPVDRKMIINALNSGANVFMADFEDANSPDLGRTSSRARSTSRDAVRRHDRLRRARDGQDATRSNEQTATLHRPAARLAPRREARRASTASRCPASLFDFGLFFFHNAQGAARARHRARTSTCPRWRATSRRASGTTSSSARRRRSASRAARSRRRAHRDAAGRLRDGRDPLRAARALGGPQLRPLGLHLQLHQEARASDPAFVLPDRGAGHDGPARSCAPTRSSSSRPATAAACTRWAAWRRRSRSRTTRPRTRRRSRRCAPTSCARSTDGHDGTWVAHPGLVADRAGDLRRAHAGPEPARATCATTCTSRAPTCSRVPTGTRTEAGLRHNVRVGIQYLEAWLRGIGLRAALQPDGGRRDRRDLARPGLAVAPPRRALDDGAPSTPSSSRACVDEEMQRIRARGRRRALRARPLRRARATLRAALDRAASSRTS